MTISWPARYSRRPRGRGVLDPQHLVAADELAVVVADQRAGQQVRLAQHLEAVADAEHGQPVAARPAMTDSITGAKRAIAPAAQVVAVGEPAGQDHRVDVVQVGSPCHSGDGLAAGDAHRARGVAVVEAAGEGDDADAQSGTSVKSSTRCGEQIPASRSAASAVASPRSPRVVDDADRRTSTSGLERLPCGRASPSRCSTDAAGHAGASCTARSRGSGASSTRDDRVTTRRSDVAVGPLRHGHDRGSVGRRDRGRPGRRRCRSARRLGRVRRAAPMHARRSRDHCEASAGRGHPVGRSTRGRTATWHSTADR